MMSQIPVFWPGLLGEVSKQNRKYQAVWPRPLGEASQVEVADASLFGHCLSERLQKLTSAPKKYLSRLGLCLTGCLRKFGVLPQRAP
jgi:hypothetical protein